MSLRWASNRASPAACETTAPASNAAAAYDAVAFASAARISSPSSGKRMSKEGKAMQSDGPLPSKPTPSLGVKPETVDVCSFRLRPTPARSRTTATPAASRTDAGPMPDSWSRAGLWIAPAATTTSLLTVTSYSWPSLDDLNLTDEATTEPDELSLTMAVAWDERVGQPVSEVISKKREWVG